jgi:hypothetical protein
MPKSWVWHWTAFGGRWIKLTNLSTKATTNPNLKPNSLNLWFWAEGSYLSLHFLQSPNLDLCLHHMLSPFLCLYQKSILPYLIPSTPLESHRGNLFMCLWDAHLAALHLPLDLGHFTHYTPMILTLSHDILCIFVLCMCVRSSGCKGIPIRDKHP